LFISLFYSSIDINTVIVTAGTFEPQWKREVWCLKIWFNPPFLWKCLYQVKDITVFTVFRFLTDFVCLYTYEFWLSLWKIVRSSVMLLLFYEIIEKTFTLFFRINLHYYAGSIATQMYSWRQWSVYFSDIVTMTGTNGAGTAYPSWAHGSPGFQWGLVCSIFSFIFRMFCRYRITGNFCGVKFFD
jgi:hypothetical protein